MIRANYNTPETVPLYQASLAMYRTLSQELDFNVLFTNQGELDLCHTKDSLQVEREKSLLNRTYGVQTDILTPDGSPARNHSSICLAAESCRSSGPRSTRRARSPGMTPSCGGTRSRRSATACTSTKAWRSPAST